MPNIKATGKKIIIMKSKDSPTQGIIIIPKVETPIHGTENVFKGIIQEMKELNLYWKNTLCSGKQVIVNA